MAASGSIVSEVREIAESEFQNKTCIGTGGFGTVFSATWNFNPVAIKYVYTATDAADPQSARRLKQEARILANLRHRNIVQLYGVGPTYLVMEHVPHTLRQVLDSSLSSSTPLSLHLSVTDKLKISFDLCSAMIYLLTSSPPILHRDLKSSNILIDDSKRPKICDFGLSKPKSLESRSSSVSMASSINPGNWMAPEILLCDDPTPTYNEQSEVYSFGVVLWEMITEQVPFHGLNDQQIMRHFDRGESLRLEATSTFGSAAYSNYPADFLALAEKCLLLNPVERPCFSEFATMLERILRTSSHPPVAEASSPHASHSRSARATDFSSIACTLSSLDVSSKRDEADSDSCESEDVSDQSLPAITWEIGEIVSAMKQHASHVEIQEKGCWSLLNLSDNADNKVKIASVGGVEVILSAMKQHSSHAEIQEYGCKALLILSFHSADNKVKIASVGGVEVILSAMKQHASDAKFQKYGCWALFNLSVNADNSVKIASVGGVEVILSAMEQHASHSEVQHYGCKALVSLSANADNSIKIASVGGVEVILSAMKQHASHAEIQQYGCKALVNLARNDDNNVKIAVAGVEVILSAMKHHASHAEIQENGCGALLNLAVNADNRVKIASVGGVEVIVSAMKEHAYHAEIQKRGCMALVNLSAKNADNKVKIASVGGLEVIEAAMQRHSYDSTVQERGLSALRKLKS